ncbi:HPr family phosphocarrier protein [Bacillus sp. C28GYM-DRY-1]|uniref:HPr family phosphocarrier protein n=1 Tax=Bacillus sp. C28GYM-DRY-1 TaxID=3062686 RepID=UPI002676DCF6|nr:HPr family phosphocarrier protein [Bacillus sp. C28GYM-DRY-1]MDO3661459.1 HPr family phosphocarrier protein [Bacillus sp. C28GYM-DRY-1]
MRLDFAAEHDIALKIEVFRADQVDEVSRSHLSFSLKNPTKSLIIVMSLSITPGTHIQIRAEGIDEEEQAM